MTYVCHLVLPFNTGFCGGVPPAGCISLTGTGTETGTGSMTGTGTRTGTGTIPYVRRQT